MSRDEYFIFAFIVLAFTGLLVYGNLIGVVAL